MIFESPGTENMVEIGSIHVKVFLKKVEKIFKVTLKFSILLVKKIKKMHYRP